MFQELSRRFTTWTGSPAASVLAVSSILIWALGGIVYFGFGSDYQIIMNSVTTAITFCMVFVLQNSQTHDTKAIQAKLDELIAAIPGARDSLVAIEDQGDNETIDSERLDPARDKV